MDLEKKQNSVEWYDNPSIVTNIIIGLIAIIVILSQSFAINNNLSTEEILKNIINHNSIYLITLVYFVALKTYTGKKYFNFLNVFLILLYFITSITSVLTVFQSFSLSTLLKLALHIVIFIYLFHTFLKRTRVWKEFKLAKSPFNEIKNDAYFYTIVILVVMLLAVNLVSTTTFDGTVLALLDSTYLVLFARYIYLYGCFVDSKMKKVDSSSDMEEIEEKVEEAKDKLEEVVSDIKEKVENKLDDIVDINSKDKKKETTVKNTKKKREE